MKFSLFKKYIILGLMTLVALNAAVFAAGAAGEGKVNPHLQQFKPFIGKTWKGDFVNSTPEKPIVDIAKWELVLNGQAIRVMHSVNNGEYGGETMIVWDAAKEKLVYYYFTTAGFFTTGTFSFDGQKYISHEYVTGNQNGITEVKGIGEILPDGRLHSKSQYYKDGNWSDGHEIYYVEDAGAQVIFK